MNFNKQGVLLDSYQYAPVYFIQEPSSTQAMGNYVIRTKNSHHGNVSTNNNLKSFYENSNNIECEVLSSAGATDSDTKSAFLQPQREVPPVGNKLKLASFLLPNNENAKVQLINNVVTPNAIASKQCNMVVNTLAKLNIERKLVKIKDVPNIRRQCNKRTDKIQPKIKPKLKEPVVPQSKYTSVQLIKLGETYHSLNKLSEDQIKMVNKALKMFKDPNKSAPEPTYDPVTNTRYIYKIVSPKDLAVVGKKKALPKDNKKCVTKTKKTEEKQVALSEGEEDTETPAQAKVTRSGRLVKLPKQIVPENSTHRAKKKSDTIVTCCQCSSDFGSLYRLQKHYEQHPTHMPTRIHSNLFHCLRAIVRGAGGGGGNMLVQQLEQLLLKLRSLLPCLLASAGHAPQPCTIGDDLGRLFGVAPGKYHLDVEALDCVKDKDGSCAHSPRPAAETDCARSSSVARWPTVSKRNWKLKHRSRPADAKRMRLPPDEGGSPRDDSPAPHDVPSAPHDVPSAPHDVPPAPHDDPHAPAAPSEATAPPDGGAARFKRDHIQFHSAHFDIRSSPIKSSSTIFRKFQIDPSKLGTFEARALSLAAADDARPAPELQPRSPAEVQAAQDDSTDIDPEIKEWIIAADAPAACVGEGGGESVLTFLDALGAELAAPASVDFQLDLFA